MNRYTNNWVRFLNNTNTIIINGERDFKSFNSLCKKVGLDFPYTDYWSLLHIAQINHCVIGYGSVLVEYNCSKGFTIGYKSIEESEKWFEQKPFKIKDLLKGE